jgi:hypothetical protein
MAPPALKPKPRPAGKQKIMSRTQTLALHLAATWHESN